MDSKDSVKLAYKYDGALPPLDNVKAMLGLFFEEFYFDGEDQDFDIVLKQMNVPEDEKEKVKTLYMKNKSVFERLVEHTKEKEEKQQKVFHYNPAGKFYTWDSGGEVYTYNKDVLAKEAQYDGWDVYTGDYIVIFNPTKSNKDFVVDTRDIEVPFEDPNLQGQQNNPGGMMSQIGNLPANVQQQLQQAMQNGNQQQVQQILQQHAPQNQSAQQTTAPDYSAWEKIVEQAHARDVILVVQDGEIKGRY